MPQNAFAISDKTYNKPNRNAFPLSHAVNFTTKFGDIIPVFCKPVYSGDSFRIRPAFGLQFMPMIFPIQSRIRAKLSFFYVRKRNLWKDYMDFYGKTKDNLVPPYIECNSDQMNKMFRLSQLADNFGIPVTAYGHFEPSQNKVNFIDLGTLQSGFYPNVVTWNSNIAPNSSANVGKQFSELRGATLTLSEFLPTVQASTVGLQAGIVTENNVDLTTLTEENFSDLRIVLGTRLATMQYDSSYNVSFSNVKPESYNVVGFDSDDKCIYAGMLSYDSGNNYEFSGGNPLSLETARRIKRFWFLRLFGKEFSVDTGVVARSPYTIIQPQIDPSKSGNFVSIVDNAAYNPYGVGEGKQKLSAMPFRAYEQIYNVYYRNSKNNPLIINGVTEYNKICRTVEGGADSYTYEVKKHNWELDFLTSAVQSPQQGVAPLVGITATGQMTFQDTEGNIYKAQADIDDDGTIKGFKIGETGLPQGTLRSLVDTVSSGISINDLRNVNSFQRWLETNMRRGMRYVDQVKSHFGVDVDYNAMEYPEFIGGFSREVDINTILNQTSGAAPLGEMGGLARVSGSSQHDISKYIPENGYIIGLLTVIPIPTYSQVLPKHFLLNSVFDEYFPEFGKIGMQPILMSEVAPIQQYMADKTKMNQVFGYQRPWYDLLGAIDEVHGEYRTTLRDYLINRVFDTPPELGEEFLLVDDSQVNSVFAETKNDHSKILGQIVFNVDAKRPIPLFGVPSLE